jgi:hypothetical protein
VTIDSGAHVLTVNAKTLPADIPAGGRVRPNGEVMVQDGADYEFAVTVNEGYYVASARVLWADGTKNIFVVNDGKFTVPAVTQAGAVTVTFKAQYTISVSALPQVGGYFCDDFCYGGGGMFQVNGGTDKTFTFQAHKGWMIDEVKIDGVVNETAAINGSYTFVKVDANHAVDVIFERTGEYHSADTGYYNKDGIFVGNMDNIIDMPELLRVIQLFNTDTGTGMGKYICDGTSEDGYAPGDDAAMRTCMPHDADSDDNWELSLSELLRVIQFWSLGGYHKPTNPADAGSDGFAPGPK